MVLSYCKIILLRGITSNHYGDFYCLNCFHSHTTKKILKSMKGYAKNMIFVIQKCQMKTKKKKKNFGEKSIKVPHTIYADFAKI